MPAAKKTAAAPAAPAGVGAEQIAQAQQVADAGANAAAAAAPGEQQDAARDAMRNERDRTGLPMADEDIDRVADLLVTKTVAAFEQRGAFDHPPDPVVAPAGAGTAPADGEPPVADLPPAAPVKRTFADRFMGT
jgi:hypothetical protein